MALQSTHYHYTAYDSQAILLQATPTPSQLLITSNDITINTPQINKHIFKHVLYLHFALILATILCVYSALKFRTYICAYTESSPFYSSTAIHKSKHNPLKIISCDIHL